MTRIARPKCDITATVRTHLADEVLETVGDVNLAGLEVRQEGQELMLHIEIVDIVAALEE
ncbi:hypothetical protein D3C72_2482000 [compost metagenome]